MRKLLFSLLIVISIFAVVGCSRDTDAERFKEEYEQFNEKTVGDSKYKYPSVEINKKNPIKYASYDEVLELLNDGTGIIYLGYPACPWCRTAVPVLLDAANEVGVEEVYYIDMTNERDEFKVKEDGTLEVVKEGSKGYKRLLDRLDVILEEYTLNDIHGNTINVGEKRVYVPLVIFVREGEIVAYHLDTVPSQVNPFEKLTEDQYNELMDIYINYIHKMLNDVCDKEC